MSRPARARSKHQGGFVRICAVSIRRGRTEYHPHWSPLPAALSSTAPRSLLLEQRAEAGRYVLERAALDVAYPLPLPSTRPAASGRRAPSAS